MQHRDARDPLTLCHRIGGRWVRSASDEVRHLVNPATEEVIAVYPAGCAADVDTAVAAARAAQLDWRMTPLGDRLRLIEAAADRIERHADELARLECEEMGRPAAIGVTFVVSAAAQLRASTEDARTYPFERRIADGSGTTRVLRRPLGVAGVITPWNFPVAAVVTAIGPILAAGNTVVVKPSERSPLSTSRLIEVLGLPDGVANLVLGDAGAGKALVEHDDVAFVHFTGSVEVGRLVGSVAGHKLRRAVLELGGKDPVVVDADVDPVATAEAVAFGAFMNTGQICTSMERIYVHRDVAEPFTHALVAAAGRFGFGSDDSLLGPLVDARQRDHVHAHVIDAVSRGATVLTGGYLPPGKGYYYPATVLTNVDESMLVMTEETFGPIAPVQVVDSFAEGLARAAASRYGLAATVYTRDPRNAAAAAGLPAGLVWVNEWQGGAARVYEPAADSGLGATGGHAAYDAATRPTTVFAAGI